MNVETIKGMLSNSTWKDNENRTIYQFSNERDLSINGKNHLQYSISSIHGKALMHIGPDKKYTVEYINDFILKLYSNSEQLSLMPE